MCRVGERDDKSAHNDLAGRDVGGVLCQGRCAVHRAAFAAGKLDANGLRSAPLGTTFSRLWQKKSRQNQAAVVACGDSFFPATSSPLFWTQGTLKVGFLSNLQVAGWFFGNHRS